MHRLARPLPLLACLAGVAFSLVGDAGCERRPVSVVAPTENSSGPSRAAASPPPSLSDAGAVAPEPSAPVVSLTGEPMRGPYARFPEDVCRAFAKGKNRCEANAAWSSRTPAAPARAGILEARLFGMKVYLTGHGKHWSAFGVALRTRKGWFAKVYDAWETGVPMSGTRVEAQVTALRLERLQREREAPLLTLDHVERQSMTAIGGDPSTGERTESNVTFATRYLTFCSVGASDVPSCARLAVGCTGVDGWIEMDHARDEARITTRWAHEEGPFCMRGEELGVGKFELQFP